MKRREFITLLAGTAAWPLATRAQQAERMRRIGVLMGFAVAENDSEGRAFVAAFRDGLQKLGWTEGSNIRLDTRWATPADAESMQRFAKELVALQPDLILSSTTPTDARRTPLREVTDPRPCDELIDKSAIFPGE